MKLRSSRRPTRSICCSTTPASAAAAACSPIPGSSGKGRSTSAGAASISASAPSFPLLLKADEGHIVNTSSVNGFWASVGLGVSHTAYSAAKFAVKGFTEALINDLKLNAPHIKCSVVMPGHIGTSIVSNTRKVQSGTDSDRLNENDIAQTRVRLTAAGIDASKMTDEDVQAAAGQ